MISVLGHLALPELVEFDLPWPLAEYVAIRQQHGQVLNLIAVLEGQKPCLDDWVPAPSLPRLEALCQDAGLHLRAGIQFDVMSHDDAERVIGSGTLTTTRARARPLGDQRGSVHVFVGHDPQVVEQTFLSGWYPLVVGDRATSKPWIDHMWFGQGLGYPQCCLEAFARNNNWAVNNMPYQAARTTSRPNALANSIMRFTGLTWAPHLPCSYDCEATVAQSAALRSTTQAYAPALVPIADALTSGTWLLLSEWEAFALRAVERDGDIIRYDAVSLVPSNRPNERLYEALCDGDTVELRDDLVLVRNGDSTIFIEACRTDGFAPRVPLLLEFHPPNGAP